MSFKSRGSGTAGVPSGRSAWADVLVRLGAVVTAVAVGLILAGSAPASPVVLTGEVTDAGGDGPEPARDLVSAAAEYRPATGALTFSLETAGTPDPTEDAQFLGAVGQLDGEGVCTAPTLILATVIPGSTTLWLRDDDGRTPAEFSGTADRKIAGSRITLNGTDRRMVGRPATCAVAVISDAGSSSTNWDETRVFPLRQPKVARLKVRLTGVPGTVRRGKSFKGKIRISNPGNSAARKVKLKVGLRGRATIRPRSGNLGSIGAGKAKVVDLRLKTTANSSGTVRINARATAANAKPAADRKTTRIKVPRRPRPQPTGGSGLAGRLFWGFEPYAYDHSAGVIGLHFVNRKFVHLGMPKGGLSGCKRVTARVKQGKLTSGCVRYSFSPRTGKVRIGGSSGTWRGGKLRLKMKGRESHWRVADQPWFGSSLPRSGARFQVKLRNMGYFGACGISPACTTWTENLILLRNGQFGRQKSTLTTGGGGGLPFVAISKLGPDERGRYRVLSRSRIRFSYASGRVENATLAIQLNKRGRPDPTREGLLLNDLWFFHDTD